MKHFKISCPTTEATDTPQEEADVGTFLTRCATLTRLPRVWWVSGHQEIQLVRELLVNSFLKGCFLALITQGVVGLRPSGNPTS